MARTIATACATVCCIAFLTAGATDQDLERQLSSQYHDKVLVLRHPFTSSSQKYATDGTPAKTGEEGSWTLYGRIVVKNIKVDAHQLRVEGRRALYTFDKSGRPVPLLNDSNAETVQVTMLLAQPLATSEEAAATLGRVFAMTSQDEVRSVPPYWQAYLAKQLGVPVPTNPSPVAVNPAQEFTDSGRAKDSHAGGDGYTAPKPMYTPEPEFTLAARRSKFGGSVGLNINVDKTGRVRDLTIVRPLGLGLDDNAVKTVSTWRFSPATYRGEPLNMAQLYVEVSFSLF